MKSVEIKEGPFNENVDRYERWFENHQEAYLSELRAVKMTLPAGGNGLEVGVGSGRFSEPFSIDVGIDPSRDMLIKAKVRNIEVVEGIGEELPFEDSVFDFVLIVTTICFFKEPERALEEVFRVIKKGGYVIIGFVDRESRLGRLYEKKKEENVFYREARFYSVDEVEKLLMDAGFRQFSYSQTLFQDLDSIDEIEEPKSGWGEGSFVVIRGRKR